MVVNPIATPIDCAFATHTVSVAGDATKVVATAHGLSAANFVEIISDTKEYNGRYEVKEIDDDNFYIEIAFDSDNTGTFNKVSKLSKRKDANLIIHLFCL